MVAYSNGTAIGERPLQQEPNRSTERALESIVGRELSAVVFVRDYIQLQFDGAGLSALNLPMIKVGQQTLAFGEPGYRDALCERIGRAVRSASVEENERILMEFEDGSTLSISLRPDDYSGPEAAIFNNGPEETWVL
jgi:hypothetical protein